jgi:Zn-finger domain-containing protein
MVLISELSKWGRESFKKVSNILKQERIGSVKTVSVVIRVKEKNRWIRKRVSLDSEYSDSYEEEIRKQYGKNVRIELIQFHRIKPTIINDKHARAALAIGYVKYSENIIDKSRNVILKENLKNLDSWNQYQKILHDIKLQTPEFIEDEDLEEWRNHELEEKLKKLKFMDKFGELNKDLKRDQIAAEIIDKKIFSKIASSLIIWDIFKFYLTTSNDRRKRYGGPFPYLRSDIDRKQRKIFEYLDEKIVNLLKKYENEQIVSLTNMDLILNEKFNLERKIKGSNIKIDYVALGAALIYSNSNTTIEEVANAFNVSQKAIQKEMKNIKNIQKPKSKKSEKFLEMIKK